MKRSLTIACAVATVACTDVPTNPNTVVALRFNGAAYPSIVAGDSLRDSLGVIQKLAATALNYKNDPVSQATFAFSSTDTILKVFSDGVVFARGLKTDATNPARVFASIGALQSQPDSLYVVARVDSIRPETVVDTIPLTSSGGATENGVLYTLFADTAAGKPKVLVPAWLVSYQLRHGTTLLSPTDTSFAYTFVVTNTTPPRRLAAFVDTTDASGKTDRRVFVQPGAITASEDTLFLIATAQRRKVGLPPIRKETMIVVRRQ